jgi:hypothetical protein
MKRRDFPAMIGVSTLALSRAGLAQSEPPLDTRAIGDRVA